MAGGAAERLAGDKDDNKDVAVRRMMFNKNDWQENDVHIDVNDSCYILYEIKCFQMVHGDHYKMIIWYKEL